MTFIDTHAHLADITHPPFKHLSDVDDVISRAKSVGVKGIVVVTEEMSEVDRAMSLKRKYPKFIHAAIGLHPAQPPREGDGGDGIRPRTVRLDELPWALEVIRENADDLVAVGEIGLDFSPHITTDRDEKDVQREIFRQQLKLAQEIGIPATVHSRSAGRPVVELLRELNIRDGDVVLHAFDGKPSVALQGAQLGCFFSIPPCIARSEQKQRITSALPIDRLLLETDCPALGPVKGEPNEPDSVVVAFDHIAQLKEFGSREELCQLILQNTKKVFKRIEIDN